MKELTGLIMVGLRINLSSTSTRTRKGEDKGKDWTYKDKDKGVKLALMDLLYDKDKV